MASSSNKPVSPDTFRAEGALALVAIGAALLFVSLFLHWFEPGRSAWTVFEVWDLVLAVLSLVTLVAAAGRMGFGRSRPDSWLVAPSVVALVVVVASLLNHPPAAIGEDPMIGIWLALIATVLMMVGAVVTVAGVSVAINIHAGAANRRPVVTPDAGRKPSGTRGPRLRRPARRTESPAADAVADRPDPPAGEVGTEATRVLDEDPASRREPPAPPR